MKTAWMTGLILMGMALLVVSAGTSSRKAPPLEIVQILNRFKIPGIDIEKASLEEVLDFVILKYHNSEIDDPPPDFAFEYRLTEHTRKHIVSVHARDVTYAQALELALKNVPVSLLFESGKIVFIDGPSK